MREARIGRRALAAIRLRDQADAVAVGAQDAARPVGRAIVDDDDLDMRIGLSKGAVDSVANILFVVIVADDDRHMHTLPYSDPRRTMRPAPG